MYYPNSRTTPTKENEEENLNLFTVKSGWLPSFEYESLLSETDDNVSPVTVSL